MKIIYIIFFMIMGISIGQIVSEYNTKCDAIKQFQPIEVPIKGAITNTYGVLSAVWVYAGNGSIPMNPIHYLPKGIVEQSFLTAVPAYLPLIINDANKPNEQKMIIKLIPSDDQRKYVLYEIHLLPNTLPQVNSADHGEGGEY